MWCGSNSMSYHVARDQDSPIGRKYHGPLVQASMFNEFIPTLSLRIRSRCFRQSNKGSPMFGITISPKPLSHSHRPKKVPNGPLDPFVCQSYHSTQEAFSRGYGFNFRDHQSPFLNAVLHSLPDCPSQESSDLLAVSSDHVCLLVPV